MTSKEKPLSTRRTGFGIAILFVTLMGVILSILLMAYGSSTQTASRTRSNSKLGNEAKITCINAIEEAAYHFITRSNSPRLSKKDKDIDLYTLLRSIDKGTSSPYFNYELPPVYTRRVSHNRRISVSDVKVRVSTTRPPPPQEETSGTQNPQGTEAVESSSPKNSYESIGSALINGDGARYCDTIIEGIEFDPVVTLIGVVEFSATAKIVGPHNTVERDIVQRRVMTLTRLTDQADISISQLSPNRVFTHITRRVHSKDKTTKRNSKI